MASGPPPRGVMVCVRTRPTAAFAQEEILIDEAANVSATLSCPGPGRGERRAERPRRIKPTGHAGARAKGRCRGAGAPLEDREAPRAERTTDLRRPAVRPC